MECKLALDDAVGGDLVVKQEAIAVGAEHERDLQHFGIAQRLLHAIANRVVVVLGFDNGDGDVRLVEQNVIGAFVLGAGMQLAAHDDPSLGEWKFLPDLG